MSPAPLTGSTQRSRAAQARPPTSLVRKKRMVKKQQMRWTPRGAHLLLQVRTRVLNNDLTADFHRWYPGFTNTPPDQEKPVRTA
jgi:hypothetical protein